MVNIPRTLRHGLMPHWRVGRAFPPSTLDAIEREIRASEARHAGQIMVAIEGALHGRRLWSDQPTRERALEVFSHLRVWDTEHRNGVLIYLLLADRAVEIVADRGAHGRIGAQEWAGICRMMEQEFRSGRYQESVVKGVQALTAPLTRHFPRHQGAGGAGGLPDAPVLL